MHTMKYDEQNTRYVRSFLLNYSNYLFYIYQLAESRNQRLFCCQHLIN